MTAGEPDSDEDYDVVACGTRGYLLDKTVHVCHGCLTVLPPHFLTVHRDEVRLVRMYGL